MTTSSRTPPLVPFATTCFTISNREPRRGQRSEVRVQHMAVYIHHPSPHEFYNTIISTAAATLSTFDSPKRIMM